MQPRVTLRSFSRTSLTPTSSSVTSVGETSILLRRRRLLVSWGWAVIVRSVCKELMIHDQHKTGAILTARELHSNESRKTFVFSTILQF